MSNLTQIAPSVFEIRVPKVSFKILRFSFLDLFFVFSHTYKNRYKTQRMLGSSWNLVHKTGVLKGISVPFLVQIRQRFTELWLILVKKIDLLSRLLGKLLRGLSWNLACRWSEHSRSAFLWFERNPKKDHGDMIQNPTGVKITRSNLRIKIPPNYAATIQSSELKIDL